MKAIRSRNEIKLGITHWQTKDGRVLRPEEMSRVHCFNTIRMVLRSKRIKRAVLEQALSAFAYAASAPEGASMAAEAAGIELFDLPPDARLATALEAIPVLKPMLARTGGLRRYLLEDL